jgi:heme-degrading monooxygenase HmoA
MFVILWEFQVKSGFEDEFVNIYGAGGDWARLFHGSIAYKGTRLARDLNRDAWFYTIDIWETRQDFEHFREARAAEYAELDRRCDGLTAKENFIGSFQQNANE